MKRSVLYPAIWSNIFAFFTLSIICSGLPQNGPEAFPVIVGVGLAFGLLPFKWHRYLLPYGVVVLASAEGTLYLKYGGFEFVPTLVLLGWGSFFLYRVMNLSDYVQLNRDLREQLTVDSVAIGVSFLIASIGGHGSTKDWQEAVLPFTMAFFGLRLYALSASFQEIRRAKLDLKKNQSLSIVVLFAASIVFVYWSITHAGSLMRDALYAVLGIVFYPFVYVIGHILQFFVERYQIHWAVTELDPTSASNSFNQVTEAGQSINWQTAGLQWTLAGLFIFGGVYLILSILRTVKRNRTDSTQQTIQESREFLLSMDSRVKNIDVTPAQFATDAPTNLRIYYQEFLQSMEKKGHERLPHESAFDFIKRIEMHISTSRQQILDLTELYMWERYGGRKMSETQAELIAEELLKKIL